MTSWNPDRGDEQQSGQPPQYGQPPQPPQYPAAPQQYGQQPPPYQSAPAYSGGYGQPAAATGTNGLAIASLILAFFCSLAGIVTGVIALNQIKRSGQGGRGLAIAGIVIGAASILISIIYFAAIAGSN